MRRSTAFLLATQLIVAAQAFALGATGGEAPALGETRVYRVSQVVKLDQIPEGAKSVRWWISIPDDDRFQDVLDFSVVSTPGTWRIERESDYGNRFLYVEIPNPKAPAVEATVEFTLRRQPVLIEVDPAKTGPITDIHRRLFANDLRRDAPHMQASADIAAMAEKVCGSETNVATQAQRLLAHVVDNADHYSKDKTKPNCGVGDAQACIKNGGGCCTDLHSLFIALARARGIPARLEMGYRMQEKNLGKEVDPGYRCWVEYFVPNYGWVPADIVEADATDGQGPKRWFTGLTERRLWLNHGREFVLPSAQAGPRVNTMSIGYAEIDGRPARVLPEGELTPQLSRKITCRELSATAAN